MKSEDLILVGQVLPALLVVIAVAGGCGALARRLGQPRVIGEIIGGLLLGPSVFGLIAPGLHDAVFPAEATKFFVVLANIGLALYMFVVGLRIEHHGPVAARIKGAGLLAGTGIIPTFGLGMGLGYLLHDRLAPDGVSPTTFAVFLGCALSITALPVLARILEEQNLVDTRLGGLVLTAATVDDAAAWCLLAVSLALGQTGGAHSPLLTIAGAIGIVLIAMLVVRPFLGWLGRRVSSRGALSHGELSAIIVTVLLTGWAADLLGVFAAFGGFVIGMVAPRNPALAEEVTKRVGMLNGVLVLPIFFAAAGMNTYLWGLGSPALLWTMAVIIVVAIGGKYGCALTARRFGLSWRESFAVGALMNTRGVMELVIAGAGLAYGLISQEVFSMLVVMTLITTAMTLPLCRRLLRLDTASSRVSTLPGQRKSVGNAKHNAKQSSEHSGKPEVKQTGRGSETKTGARTLNASRSA